jgi:hypothetical protein
MLNQVKWAAQLNKLKVKQQQMNPYLRSCAIRSEIPKFSQRLKYFDSKYKLGNPQLFSAF